MKIWGLPIHAHEAPLQQVNDTEKLNKIYKSCRENGSLMPVAIELQKEAGEAGTVYTPFDTTELWQLAKEIISSLDCGAFSSAL